MKPSKRISTDQAKNRRVKKIKPKGFALVTVLFLISILVILLAVLAASVSLSQRSVSAERNAKHAKESALFGLKMALGELQAAAGPDQRITAQASILDSTNNRYTGGTNPAPGQQAWTGVWKSNTVDLPNEPQSYDLTNPNSRSFVGWLVSSTDDEGNFALPQSLSDVEKSVIDVPPSAEGIANHLALASNSDGTAQFQVEKVLIDELKQGGDASSHRVLRKRYFAFAVEDEGVKADLSWSELPPTPSTPSNRGQASRLSAMPGPDYKVFDQLSSKSANKGLFESMESPLSAFSDNPENVDITRAIEQMRDPSDLTGLLDANAEWLKDSHPHITFGSRGILCDVKRGGLRKDLSLAFEMDGAAESEIATLFNQQTEAFVGNGDQLSAPYPMPGMTQMARHLFRDTPGSVQPFSSDITQLETVVRGPSWWLMRDYANLYKQLKTFGNHYALEARSYFPNRSVAEDLVDIHADNQWQNRKYGGIKVSPVNRETNSEKNSYAYRPVKASYAPVLLGVNAIYSLVYKDRRLQMTVDPFFIVWNPYNTQITADRFAITLESGFAGGVRFRVTDADGKKTLHGVPSWWAGGRGSDTFFFDYAKHKSGGDAHLSYLVSNLTMAPGEVMIYSPPNESERSDDANVLNDELLPGMNYNATSSGIFFDEFPNDVRPDRRWWRPQPHWDTIPGTDSKGKRVPNIDPAKLGQCEIEVLFNVASQNESAIVNIIETSLPEEGVQPNQLTTEAKYGEQLSGQEYRLNWGGRSINGNISTGKHGFSHSYTFRELGETKRSFGLLSMLTMPTDYGEAALNMEVFSHINATPIVRTQLEYFGKAPLNIVVKTIPADGINNLINEVGIDFDAFGNGSNGFYGKNYDSIDGDTSFPLLDIPSAPLHSLVQFSGANLGTRLFEPTHAVGNSWKPPYIPPNSIYHNSTSMFHNPSAERTLNDVSWQTNDALFDGYYLSGLAPEYTIGPGGYSLNSGASLEQTLTNFYGSDHKTAMANPLLLPYLPTGKSADDVIDDLTPSDVNSDSYKKLGAYSFIKGAFNVNSTSVAAWAALLSGNNDLEIEYPQGGSETSGGSPFPLSNSPIDTDSNNGWGRFSRLSEDQIWDKQGTLNDPSDDTGLAVEIVEQVKTRGPFMSLSDFINRRITNDADANQGAIQEAIEQANINGDQTSGIRSQTSEGTPNYSNYPDVFPFADPVSLGDRNNATGVPLEINQANVLLPLAPRLGARSDTFRVRAYGEVRNSDESRILSRATCEAVIQRLPEYMDSNTNEPWAESDELSDLNQKFGRRFKIVQFRWLAPDEI